MFSPAKYDLYDGGGLTAASLAADALIHLYNVAMHDKANAANGQSTASIT